VAIMAPRTPSGHGLGLVEHYRWDPRNAAHPAHAVIGAGPPPPRKSMADLVHTPPGQPFANQGLHQSCVGWALHQIIHVRSRAIGIAPITPSPTAIYYQARARRYGWDAIWDGGSNPHEALSSLRDVGIVPYASWPHAKPINDCPDPDAYRMGADKDWLSYRWVLTSGAARTHEVVSLLASGRPVFAALQVDEDLESWGPGDAPWTRRGPVLGGHAVSVVGYDTTEAGKRVFVVANSWGPIHDSGFFLMSQTALESTETTYLATVEIDPEKVP
jgi:hypothetical protein